jgi:serine/threonine-protein kinase
VAGQADQTQSIAPPGPLAPGGRRDLELRSFVPAQSGLQPGQRLGDYVVRRLVGRGGMGIVYEGEHVSIGLKVALKVLRQEPHCGTYTRDLLAEARAASAIRHHGIIDIFGFGEQPGIGQYLVMEYLEGHSLDEIIQRNVPLALSEALPLLCEVLDALSAAHAAGVIHRDLKPSNIFIAHQSDGTRHVKVLDFGLAKQSDVPYGAIAQSHPSLVVGTPRYMAPEQALGQEVGPRSDLYAVGVIAFELLTGRRLFPGSSHMEVLFHHLKSTPPVPSSLVALPTAIDDLLLRLLAKAPQRRPGSSSEVAHELRALLGSSAPPTVPPVQPLSQPSPRHAAAGTTEPGEAPLPGSQKQMEAASAPPQAQGPRRAWGAVAGGLLLLGLGTAILTSRLASAPRPETRRLGGQVLGADGEPLQGARVTLLQFQPGASVETETDARGLFHLELSTPQEEVRFRVEKQGYLPFDSTATLGNTRLSFALEPVP